MNLDTEILNPAVLTIGVFRLQRERTIGYTVHRIIGPDGVIGPQFPDHDGPVLARLWMIALDAAYQLGRDSLSED